MPSYNEVEALWAVLKALRAVLGALTAFPACLFAFCFAACDESDETLTAALEWPTAAGAMDTLRAWSPRLIA